MKGFLKNTTVEFWERISNLISHFTGYSITYPCWDISQSILGKGLPGQDNREIDIAYCIVRFRVNSLRRGQAKRSFYVFFIVSPQKLLNKQLRGR